MSLHYVPAGVEIYSATSAQVLVANRPNEVEETEFGKKYKHWRTREQTVSVVVKSLRNGANVKNTYDAVVPIFNSSFIKACGLTKVLANPIHGNYVKAPYEDKGIESIIDSGGFQLLKGTTDFVHPDDVVTRYNQQANIGMPLDLPVRSAVEGSFFDPVSKMIKANDDYILERLKKNVHLALISHGSTLSLRKRRLDVLDRDAEVVAIAGLNIKPRPGVDHVLNNIENLMYVVHRYHKRTRYFHVLGVTSKLWFFIYALLEASGYVREIGADSVSHRLGALVGMYDTRDFQSVSLVKGLDYKQTLPCNCPVCTVVDDMRVIQTQLVLESHNLWVRAQQTLLMHDMAKAYINGTLPLKVVYDTLALKLGMSKFQHIVHYAQEIIASGKFRPIKPERGDNTLFTGVVAPKTVAGPLVDQYKNILRKYEKFHKTKFL